MRAPSMRTLAAGWAALALVLMSVPAASAAAGDESNRQAVYQKAREDYRVYLEQLKALREQYREITDEVRKIVAEEGVPVFDADTGDLKIAKPGLTGPADAEPAASFADADITETQDEVLVTMDLPGLDKDQIRVSIREDRYLRVSGERESQKIVDGEKDGVAYHRSERQAGRFERVLELPSAVRQDGTKASYDNGVLTVRVPKAALSDQEVTVPVS